MTQQPGTDGPYRGTRQDYPPQARTDGQDYSPEAKTDGAFSEYQYREERTIALPMAGRIRGGPIWAGFAIALATWIMLELFLFAVDLGALASNVVPDADTSAWWWSGLAAAVAFFLGGLVAGAASAWDKIEDGILQGITVWAAIVVALLVLSAVGAGIGFGVVGDVLTTSPNLTDADAGAVNDAQTAAAAALLALSVTLAAAAIGGAAGAKIWPRKDTIDLRKSDRRH